MDARLPAPEPIRTARLTLRPPVSSDCEAIVAHAGDLEVSRTLARVPHPYGIEDARAFIAMAASRHADGSAVLLALDEGEGLIGVVSLESDVDAPVLGYWLARPAWGQGLMSEAAGALLRWCFDQSDADRVLSGYFEGNASSWRIQEKLGFVERGARDRKITCLATGVEHVHVDTVLERGAFKRP